MKEIKNRLEKLSGVVQVAEDIREKALAAVDKMIDLVK
jgi:quinolinate synthase